MNYRERVGELKKISLTQALITIIGPGAAFGFLIAYDWERPAWPAIVTVGGVGLSVIDALCVAVAGLAVVAAGSNLSNVRVTPITVPLLVLLASFAVSVAVGIGANGKSQVATETRPWFQLLAVFCWVVFVLRAWPAKWVATMLIATGWLLVLFASLHMAARGLGRPDEVFVGPDGIDRSTRILRSGQALFLTCCGVVAIHRGLESHRKLLYLTGILFITVSLLSQNRSVWLATAASLLAYALTFKNPNWGKISVPLLIGMLSVIAFAFTNSGSSFIGYVSAELNNRNTYNDRKLGWNYLINASLNDGVTRIVFGQSAGSGWDRPGGLGTVIDYQPHNWYLTVYLRTGLVGLACLLLAISIILSVLIRRRDALGVAWTVSLLVYGWAYGYSWYLGIILGVIMLRTSQSDLYAGDLLRQARESPSHYSLRSGEGESAVTI